MPGLDHKGPEGEGPRTGRQMGTCKGKDERAQDPGQESARRGTGMGRGRGARRGPGRGFARGSGWGRGTGFRPGTGKNTDTND